MSRTSKQRKTIPYNFGEKHLRYIKRCEKSFINVAEGAVRAGKTIDNVLAFCRALEKSRDKIHLATASTQTTAKIILGDCNGFGIEHYFRGQCRWGKFRGNEALIVKGPKTKYQTRIILFVGGSKINSFAKFRGFSIGMWIATEINLHHDNTIKEAFNRQLAALDRKVFWDLNPSPPEAKIYTDYIDAYAKKQNEGTLSFRYNYAHFTIYDNINISEESIRDTVSQYTEGSIWYRRDIKGERVSAEGLIFPEFAENKKSFIINAFPQNIRMISIGVDFGGSGSKTVFAASGFTGKFEELIALRDHKLEGGKGAVDVDRICRELYEFTESLRMEFPAVPIVGIFCDNEAQAIINSIRAYFLKKRSPVQIADCYKGVIINRIAALSVLIAQRRLKIHERCTNIIGSLQSQVWDEKHPEKLIRLDDGTKDIDTADAFEYSFSRFIKAMDLQIKIETEECE